MVTKLKVTRLSRDDDDGDDDVSDDEAELLFNFDRGGKLKPGALKPHLRLMREALVSGEAVLLDARQAAAHALASRPDAIHCPADSLADGAPASLESLDKARPIYVFSGFEDLETAYGASDALRAFGFTDVRTLDESFEALQAQVPAQQ